jgi:hypothetical protein
MVYGRLFFSISTNETKSDMRNLILQGYKKYGISNKKEGNGCVIGQLIVYSASPASAFSSGGFSSAN